MLRGKGWLALLLALVLLLTGCGSTGEKTEVPAEVSRVVEGVFEIRQTLEQQDIAVTLEKVKLVSGEDFGAGRTSDAVVISLSVDNQNDGGLQFHPDSGKILLTSGEEMLSLKGDYQETYPNGTMKRGDIYFPLQLTRLNEIDGMILELEGPVNRHYEPQGEHYIFQLQVKHPDHRTVTRDEMIKRAYDIAERLTQATGVSETYHVGHVAAMGPMKVHVIDLMVYENVEHPFAVFLNLKERVHLVGVSLVVENNDQETLFYSHARTKLLLGDDRVITMDYLMSQHMDQEYTAGAIKTGTAFFRVEEADLPALHAASLLLQSPWRMEGGERRLVSEDLRVNVSRSD